VIDYAGRLQPHSDQEVARRILAGRAAPGEAGPSYKAGEAE
jgi:hypothetical protein